MTRWGILALLVVLIGCGDDDDGSTGMDGGASDSGSMDSGADAGGETDAGQEDSGQEDAGDEDGGNEDAGDVDAGTDAGGTFCQGGTEGCICLFGSCNDGSECVAGECVSCTAGEAGCVCDSMGDCGAGLTCAPPDRFCVFNCDPSLCLEPPTNVSDMDGEWHGTFTNNLGQAGEAEFTISTDVTAGTVSVSYDLSNVTPGGPDPDPEMLTATFPMNDDSISMILSTMLSSRIYGEVNAMVSPDGTLSALGDAQGLNTAVSGQAGVNRILASYQLTSQGVANPEVGGGTAHFIRGAGDGNLELRSFENDCNFVEETAGAGGSCDAACMPPAGGCVESVCRQACSPGTCEHRCGPTEVCTAVTGEMFPSGFTFGVCTEPEVGTTAAYDRCTGSGQCVAGSFCIGFQGERETMCAPTCEADDDCPALAGFNVACVLGSSAGGGKRYCAPVCEYGGTETCPTDMDCYASFAGGTCRFDPS